MPAHCSAARKIEAAQFGCIAKAPRRCIHTSAFAHRTSPLDTRLINVSDRPHRNGRKLTFAQLVAECLRHLSFGNLGGSTRFLQCLINELQLGSGTALIRRSELTDHPDSRSKPVEDGLECRRALCPGIRVIKTHACVTFSSSSPLARKGRALIPIAFPS